MNCLENDHTHKNLCNNFHWASIVNKQSQFDGEDCLLSIQNPLKIPLSCFCTIRIYEILDVNLPFRFNVDLKNVIGLGTISSFFWFIIHKLKDTNNIKAAISTTKNNSNCEPTKYCSFGFMHMLREALREGGSHSEMAFSQCSTSGIGSIISTLFCT